MKMSTTPAMPCILVVYAWVLAGCAAAPPVHFYTLERVVPPAVATDAPAAPSAGRSLRLGAVHLPSELDRPEIVTHAGPFQVLIHDDERWASPLEDQIARVFRADLSGRLPPGMLQEDAAAPARSTPAQLVVDVQAFEVDAECTATLRASWAVRTASEDAPDAAGNESIRSRSSEPCRAPAMDAAAAMSRALGTLADHLVTPITRWSRD